MVSYIDHQVWFIMTLMDHHSLTHNIINWSPVLTHCYLVIWSHSKCLTYSIWYHSECHTLITWSYSLFHNFVIWSHSKCHKCSIWSHLCHKLIIWSYRLCHKLINWYTYPWCHKLTIWVSEWLLLNASSAIVQLYHGENKLTINEMMMR